MNIVKGWLASQLENYIIQNHERDYHGVSGETDIDLQVSDLPQLFVPPLELDFMSIQTVVTKWKLLY